MNKKIVVYSWTGNTAACAVALSEAMQMEQPFLLVEQKERQGQLGLAKGGFQASIGAKTKLTAMPDLSDVQLLILGTPVWSGTLPPAMNTFLAKTDFKGKTVYVFSTQGSDKVPEKFERKLKSRIERKGGKFIHLFVLQVPMGKQVGVEQAAPRVEKWAQRIETLQ